MLQITVPACEFWDEGKEEFVQKKEQTLKLEHSLVSLSKWEAKWNKPFFVDKEKTIEETIDYVRCMTITQNVDPEVYSRLTNENLEQISKYIEAPMTATWFNEPDRGRSREVITSEIVYYWMISMNIPFECQKWHINRLLTLIHVCSIKSQPPKKMSVDEIMQRNAALNEERKKRLNTKG